MRVHAIQTGLVQIKGARSSAGVMVCRGDSRR